jgi:NAD(P)-dependent dehydrogenase (short-subunit alcohol dehydrogenase family)
MKLQGKVCVITGGSQGLGSCLARLCRQRGAKVVIGALEDDALREIVWELEAPGLHCDVTERQHVTALADETIRRYGGLDVWINNAGIWMPYGPAEDLDFARARALMEVNYFGLAHGTVEALSRLGRRPGAIINVISVRGLEGKAWAAGYSASKFAAEGFTQAVRQELSETGRPIDLISVYPYRMKTELFGDNKHDDYDASMEPAAVAKLIIDNLEQSDPAQHLEIWSASDVRRSRPAGPARPGS